MDDLDNKLLFELKQGIILSMEPFNEIGDRLGINPQEVIDRVVKLQQIGIIRRFGVCIRPNDIGLFANALVAWKVPDNCIPEIGRYLAGLEEISHCYKRKPVNGRWEYNLYTVMHAKERQTIESMVDKISKTIKVNDYKILYSLKDLKRGLISDKMNTHESKMECPHK
jgi:siroheme decarboxylase